MLARLKQTTLSFLVVVALFLIYRLFAVPIIEPRHEPKRVAAASQQSRLAARQPQNHLGGYERFFPEGSWELDNPIVMDSANVKYLVKEYHRTPDHRILLNPCTVIYLPDGDAEAADSRRRVIILQAPHGAELQFDDQEDLDSGKIGHLLGGIMSGPVTIQSGPTRTDGGDDFLITTHDVQLKDNLIFTPNEVNFRFGSSYGHGRDMRITLLPGQGGSGSHGTNFSGVQSLQLLSDVQMHLQPSSGGFLPGDQHLAPGRTVDLSTPLNPSLGSSSPADSNGNLPVDIRCQGPFEFDLVENIATFHDRVDVVRVHPTGPGDQMNCELLNLFFGPREQPTQAADTTSAAISVSQANNVAGQQTDATHRMPQLEPKRLVARGNPVIVRAESVGGEVRGEHLEYEIPSRHFLMEASEKTVDIESPQLSGQVSRLEAWMRDEPNTPGASDAAHQNGAQNRHSVGQNGAASSSTNPKSDSRRHYEIYGGILKVWSVNHASQNEVERISVEGNVQFAQSATQSAEKPLDIRGDFLDVTQANTPDAQAFITGRSAEVCSQGLAMCGQTIHLNRGQNRLWIDGPGRMIAQNAGTTENGQPVAGTGQPAVFNSAHGTSTVDWQTGMIFDGRTAKFEGNVVGQRIDHELTQIVRAPQLQATLHQPIDFNAVNPEQQQRSQIEWTTCEGGVWLENRQMEQGSVVAVDRMLQLSTLTVNQITGDLTGQASPDQPGQLLSWRLGSAGTASAGWGGLITSTPNSGTGAAGNSGTGGNSGAATSSNVGGTDNAKQINYLNVQFQSGITGNVLKRELVFHQHVRSVYGPVPTWDAQLNADSPTGLPPGSLQLTCDQLAANQSSATQGRGTLELQATGNTRVEGQQQAGDSFTALAQQLNYSEAKGLLVLMGDGRSDAQLIQQPRPGAPQTTTAAKSFYYWPATRHVEMGEAQYIDSTQFGTNPPPRTAPVGTPSAAQQPISSPRR